jgi:hypothetical protein
MPSLPPTLAAHLPIKLAPRGADKEIISTPLLDGLAGGANMPACQYPCVSRVV